NCCGCCVSLTARQLDFRCHGAFICRIDDSPVRVNRNPCLGCFLCLQEVCRNRLECVLLIHRNCQNRNLAVDGFVGNLRCQALRVADCCAVCHENDGVGKRRCADCLLDTVEVVPVVTGCHKFLCELGYVVVN